MSTLTTEQLDARVKQARRFSLDLPGDLQNNLHCAEVSISSKTAKAIGFDTLKCTEDTRLFRKVKNGKELDGYYIHNNNCPQATTIEEAELIASLLMPTKKSLLDVINAKLETEFQNRVRSFLNAPLESKKAIKESAIQDAAMKLASGEITQEQFNSILSSAL